MEGKGRDEIHEHSIKYLETISASTFTTCPSLARFYLLKKKAKEEKRNGYQMHQHKFNRCPYCYTPYFPDSCKMRLLPKMKLTSKVKRLLKLHSEKPGSLGRFQQKLVHDFINGGNRLAMKCLQCQKTVKLPGQTRQDKFKQTQQKTEDSESVASYIPKTRKEKIKEKKKRNKQRKKEKGDNDLNAGLRINKPSVVIDVVEKQDAGIHEKEISTSQKTEENSTRNGKISSNQKHSDKSIQNLLFKDNKPSENVQSSIHKFPKVHSVKPNVASWIMSSKKKKGKRLSQQLGDILKQEKTKAPEGSLADFLSSI